MAAGDHDENKFTARNLWAFIAYIVLPFLATGISVYNAYTLDLTGEDFAAVFFFGVVASIAAFATLMAYFNLSISNTLAFTVIFLNGAAMIWYFARVHFIFGLNTDLSTKASNIEFQDAIYFSIVTFTTLGYGDFQPDQRLRLLSAMQALVGYAYLGFLVACGHHWAANRSNGGHGPKSLWSYRNGARLIWASVRAGWGGLSWVALKATSTVSSFLRNGGRAAKNITGLVKKQFRRK